MTPRPIGQLDWFDPPHLQEQLDGYICECGEIGAEVTIIPAPPHFAEIRCRRGHFIQWASGPKTPKKQKQTRRGKRMPRADDDYCDFCLKTRDMLPDGVTLEIRHRRDRAPLIDLGEPPDDDLGWICSVPCKGIELALRAWADHCEPAA